MDGESSSASAGLKLPQLKRSRGAHRGVLTRRITSIQQDDAPLEDIQATLEFLLNRRKILSELDAQIQLLIEDDVDLEADVNDAADVFIVAEKAVKWCQDRIKVLTAASTAASSSGSLTAKLPKLTLPSFSGEYTQWVSFWDQFSTLVDSKVDMANVEKLSYLKLSLKGDAAQIISSLLVTDANYDIAKRKLEERYNNKRSIVKAHLTAINALPVLKKESSVELRRLLESTNEHVQALEALMLPVDQWDAILVYWVLEKLDAESRKQFELAHPGTDVLTFNELTTFIDRRSRALESSGTQQTEAFTPKTPKKVLQEVYSSTVEQSSGCQMRECNGSHSISQCDRYKQLGTKERKAVVKKLKLCLNCLGRHFVADCPSKFSCRTCNGRHHTSLHFERTAEQGGVTSGAAFSGPSVILSTAMVGIEDTAGNTLMFRALLDSGSQTSFITADAASKLNIARSTVDVKVSGIGGGRQQTAKESVNLLVSSQKLPVRALVLNSIAGSIPSQSINVKHLKSLKGLALADANFHQPGAIQMLLGADVYEDLFLDERKKHHGLHFRKSIFGWVVTGVLSHVKASQCQSFHSFQVAVELDLARFWEVEEVPRVKQMTKENRQCVEHYDSTTYTADDGRITVHLPFKSDARPSNNLQTAKQRLFALERKLQDHDEMKQQYREFIKEFVDMGHLEQAPPTSGLCYYLPHHCVFKDSTTTKLRVVFDASSKSPNGKSLNDCLLLGPRLQDDVFDILIRFRLHQYALSADIAKMYRQVALDESDRDFHRILWRDYVTDQIQELRMTRVTYGVGSSSYHSTRALQECGKAHSPNPNTANVILNDFWVDDLLSGSDTLEEACKLQDDLIQTLNKNCLPLRKWSSNEPQLVTRLPKELQEAGKAYEIQDKTHQIKTLGLTWHPLEDYFVYVSSSECSNSITKRSLLSEVSKHFDPIGLIAPVLVVAKVFIQRCWKLDLDWNDAVPDEVARAYTNWQEDMSSLSQLQIPRKVLQTHLYDEASLQVFCDASEKAYGACVYLVAVKDHVVSSTLLSSKCKVAPIKPSTLPRLELLAVHTGAKLATAVKAALSKSKHKLNISVLYSDSTIALSWIKADPARWHTFVSNRVSQIQSMLPETEFLHVPSEDNPADLCSRGLQASQLIAQQTFWFKGPSWLGSSYPDQPQHLLTREEARQEVKSLTVVESPTNALVELENFNSLVKLLRTLCICKVAFKKDPKVIFGREEMTRALYAVVKADQKVHFEAEFRALSNGEPVNPKSSIAPLYPFMDNGVIKVGGRLAHGYSMTEDQRYPLLVSHKSKLATLAINDAHERTLHGGPTATVAELRRQIWVTQAMKKASACIKKCVTCFRFNSGQTQQLMGDLPSSRIEAPERAFSCVGLDFAGPLTFRCGSDSVKGYAAVFVCFASKAVHLEAVSSLTSDAMVAALRRFIARRGSPSQIVSDNATNFVGARRDLIELDKMVKECAQKYSYIDWHFIPPRSPNFGGLWEAAVKSMKHHLRRVMKNAVLTFEEMTTVLCQIEQVLNNRPLMALTNNPDDIYALTPSMLVNGSRLDAIPQPGLQKADQCPVKRFRALQQLLSQFWKRWSSEYVASLQPRGKWRHECANLAVDNVVLITDDGIPPLQWSLGRVIQVKLGHDGLARVALVKTSRGEFTRPISKLRPLPIEDNDLQTTNADKIAVDCKQDKSS